MKQREQALLLLRKAAQDEALLDEVLESDRVSDEVFGFHCQQAAEKMLKAVLSELGVPFRKTHEIGRLIDLVSRSGLRLPEELQEVDALSPFGAVYRYEDYDSDLALDRHAVRTTLRALRTWVERQLQERTPPDAG
jgi:HEPN domain-containing protein